MKLIEKPIKIGVILKLIFLYLLSFTLLGYTNSPAYADEPSISVHYLGHSAFIIHFNDSVHVLTDFGNAYCWGLESPIFGIGEFVPLIVTWSHFHDDHYAPERIPEGVAYTLTELDSLDLGDLSIRPVRMCENTVGVESSTCFMFEYMGYTVCHLGDAQAEIMNIEDPEQQALILEKFPEQIDLLLMTIEGIYQFIPKAELFIDLLQPGYVIPMHYWTPQYKEEWLQYLELQNDTAGKNYEIFRPETFHQDFHIEDSVHNAVKVISLDPFPYGDASSPQGNIAFKCPVFASSVFDINHICGRIADGFYETAWRSEKNDEEWMVIDLGTIRNIDTVIMHAKNPATKYDILISIDSTTWNVVYTTEQGGALIDTLLLEGIDARYIRYDCHDRKFNAWGYWIYEFEVYGHTGVLVPEFSGKDGISGLELKCHPNPAKDMVIVDYSIPQQEGCTIFMLIDESGRIIKQLSNHSGENQKEIDLRGLAPGIYYLCLENHGWYGSIKLAILP